MWCVCQDNNPGTGNLELGHTVVKMKCAASRAVEGSDDDARLRRDSELGSRTKGDRQKEEGRRQDTGREQTGEVVKAQTSRHVLVCMYAMWVRMCYCVCGWGAKPDGCIFWSCYESRGKQTHAPTPCVRPCHCTCNPGEFSCQLGWAASSGRISTGRPR